MEIRKGNSSGPLAGLKMLDLSRLLPGPYCTLLLADLGMEVLKVEDPEQGDYMRMMGSIRKNNGAYFLALNRNKKSMTLDLKNEKGKEIFYELAKKSDVVIDNFRAGVLQRLKVDYATLSAINPRIIYAAGSGYGQTGPWATKGGFDLVAQGVSGIMSVTGEPGRPPAAQPVGA